jgi:hypothetical protein
LVIARCIEFIEKFCLSVFHNNHMIPNGNLKLLVGTNTLRGKSLIKLFQLLILDTRETV